MSVESNLDIVIKNRIKTLTDLSNADKIFREAALDTVALISERVQQRGENTSGQKMDYGSRPKTGSYSKYYGLKRQKEGRQTSHVDLTYSGDMMDNFILSAESRSSYIVGFRGKDASDKAEWNEDRFGTIFQLAQSEANIILQVINRQIQNILK